ncbi:MAG: hypothetical protein EXQ97_05325 [Alphaproteobacteria bacterium]|nr:hypothetical protein [Alphaproteobacteria bacterium]
MDTTSISTMSEYLSTTLRTVSEGRERKYRTRPEGEARKSGPDFELVVVVRSIGYLDEHVKTGSGHEFIISEPVSVGGRDIAPWPLEYRWAARSSALLPSTRSMPPCSMSRTTNSR